MNIKLAIARMKEGKKVRREGHSSYIKYFFKDEADGNYYCKSTNGIKKPKLSLNEDIIADDWQVVSNKKG